MADEIMPDFFQIECHFGQQPAFVFTFLQLHIFTCYSRQSQITTAHSSSASVYTCSVSNPTRR